MNLTPIIPLLDMKKPPLVAKQRFIENLFFIDY